MTTKARPPFVFLLGLLVGALVTFGAPHPWDYWVTFVTISAAAVFFMNELGQEARTVGVLRTHTLFMLIFCTAIAGTQLNAALTWSNLGNAGRVCTERP